MKPDDLIIARARKLADVQRYIYHRIEYYQNYQNAYLQKTGEDEYRLKMEADAEILQDIACNMSIIEELRKIEKLCTNAQTPDRNA